MSNAPVRPDEEPDEFGDKDDDDVVDNEDDADDS